MKRINNIILIIVGCSYGIFAASWFERNQELKAIYPSSVWRYVEKAKEWDSRGHRQTADYYLRLVLRLTEEGRPFVPGNWPRGWPSDQSALRLLRYASPEAYVHRMIGDFALQYGRNKEAISYYKIYLEKSYVPDVDTMKEVALLLEKEGLLQEAMLFWQQLQKVQESNNYHGSLVSERNLVEAIKRLERKLGKTRLIVLDTVFHGVPDYLQEGFNKVYRETMTGLKNVEIIPDRDLDRVLKEQAIIPADLENNEELSFVGKMLNANLIVRCFLSCHESNYIVSIRLFDPERKIWFSEYEYKNQDFRYLPLLVRRFPYSFSEEGIPAELLLPQTHVIWTYETDSDITDLKLCSRGNILVCGTEDGTVYVMNNKGAVVSSRKTKERITSVGISPEGRFICWADLRGRVYFRGLDDKKGWSYPVENLVRGLALARDGSFLVVAVNNQLRFLDRKGICFWKNELSGWVTAVAIAPDATRVAVGLEDGSVLNFSEEGNLRWQMKLDSKVIKVNFSTAGNFLAAESDNGEVVVFTDTGNKSFSFVSGQEQQFTSFSPAMLETVIGRRGLFFYFFSQEKDKLWSFHVDERTVFLEHAENGWFSVAAANKNIFCLRIRWE